MKAREITKGIYWVGAIDWNVRNFHGYLTQRGTTYNAYLIIDEKVTLIDAVKPNLTEHMLSRISDIIDPSKIDIVVSNHTEMDHSGAIPKIMELNPNAELIASAQGVKGLKAHYKQDWNFREVGTGDKISIGKHTLQFISTPMVHWPDNMMCYIPEDKILFSNDAFGQHLASSERFDDEFPIDIIMEEARKYYANIVLPYSKPVAKVFQDLEGVDAKIIATSHGIIWRKHIDKILAEYKKWSSNEVRKKAIIVYDTMWQSTEKMALALSSAFEAKGYFPVMCNLQAHHMSDIMTEIISAEYICVGSPTLNNNMMPNVAGFLAYMKGLSPRNRKAVAFGSYGWGGQSVPEIKSHLLDAGLDVVKSYRIKYIPGEEDLKHITEDMLSVL